MKQNMIYFVNNRELQEIEEEVCINERREAG